MGIFAVSDDGTQDNCKYTYDGTEWKAVNITDAIALEDGKEYTFYAYYPYTEGVTATVAGMNVSADQSFTESATNSNYDLSDVLISKTEKSAYSGAAINLNYSHAYAMVEVLVAGDKIGDTAPQKIVLKDVVTDANINLVSQTITTTAQKQDVVMAYVESTENTGTYLYRAIVPEQTIAQGSTLLEVYGVNGGKNYRFKTPNKDVTYPQGKYFRMEVTIGENNTGIKFPAGSIDPWTPSEGTDLDGEEIVNPITSMEIPFDVTTQIVDRDAYKNDKITDNTNFWFVRAQKTQITYNASEGAMEIKSGDATRLTWDSSSFGYHIGSNPLEMGTYRLTFMAKTTEGVSGQTLGITFRDATDCTAFKVSSSFSGKRVQIGQALSPEWGEYKFDIDLSMAASKAGLADVPLEETDPEGCYKPTTSENLNGISIILWKNVAQDYSIFFKDMKFEKVTEEAK